MEEITKGAAHPLEDTRQKLREFLLSRGFDEIKLRDGNWNDTLEVLRKRRELPIKIFSGNTFVIIGSSQTACSDFTMDIFRFLGVQNVKNDETFFIERNNERVVVATIEKIQESPLSFKVGLKAQEIARGLSGKRTVDEMLYPQFHEKSFMTDDQIASMIKIARKPETELGKVVSEAIVRMAGDKCQQLSPCRFRAYSRELKNGKLEVWLIQPDENKTLCGTAFMNRVCVYAGSILALPPVKEQGVKTGISFVKAFADYVASAAENMNEDYKLIKVGNVGSWKDINITVPEIVQNFVEENEKKIDINGVLNLNAEIKFREW